MNKRDLVDAIANDADEYEAPRMGLVMRGAPRRLQ